MIPPRLGQGIVRATTKNAITVRRMGFWPFSKFKIQISEWMDNDIITLCVHMHNNRVFKYLPNRWSRVIDLFITYLLLMFSVIFCEFFSPFFRKLSSLRWKRILHNILCSPFCDTFNERRGVDFGLRIHVKLYG